MTLTEKVIAGAVVGLVGYEAWTLFNKDKGDTLSEAAWDSMRRPLVPFTLGALASHFVWQSQDVYDNLLRRAESRGLL